MANHASPGRVSYTDTFDWRPLIAAVVRLSPAATNAEKVYCAEFMAHLFNNIYQFERELGKGGFGTVFLAREEVSHCQVAIKQLNSQDADRQRVMVIIREPVTMNWASTLVA